MPRVGAGSRCYLLDKQKNLDYTTLFRCEKQGKVDRQMKNEAGGRECKRVSDQRGK